MKILLQSLTTAAVLSLIVAAQAAKTDPPPDAASKKTAIRQVSAPQVSPTDGKGNYQAYCSACHGPAGKGDGPAAAAMKVPPADLTRLAAATSGKYPAMHVQESIRNIDKPSHGSKDMPVWGPVFRALSSGNQAQVDLRISNLNKYIESLQSK